MIENLVIRDTLPEAYHEALKLLYLYGIECECSDWRTKTIEAPMTMQVLYPLKEPMISKCFIGGQRELQQYVMEMLDGVLDFEISYGNWEYTYHDRIHRYEVDGDIVDQVSCIINKLNLNPSSRRAVIDVRRSDDLLSDDPACLQHIQYMIRDDKLDCYVLFRSNDACKAAFMNAFALIMLQKQIADALGIEVGTYTHRANSFHCYQKDYDLLKGYIKRIRDKPNETTYNYKDDWREEMLEYVPEILRDIEKLKK